MFDHLADPSTPEPDEARRRAVIIGASRLRRRRLLVATSVPLACAGVVAVGAVRLVGHPSTTTVAVAPSGPGRSATEGATGPVHGRCHPGADRHTTEVVACYTIEESLPPHRQGVRVRGADIDRVPGASSLRGVVTTPYVRLAGTWDGRSLTVDRPPVRAGRPAAPFPTSSVSPTCARPGSGLATQDEVQAASAYAGGQSDYAYGYYDQRSGTVTLDFTGDPARHRTQSRGVPRAARCAARARPR